MPTKNMPHFLTNILSLLAVSIGCGLIACLAMHGSLIAWRKSTGQHWTRQARLLWTARASRTWIVISCLFIGVLIAVTWKLIDSTFFTLAIITCGVILGLYPSTREIEPRFTFPVWLRHTVWNLVFQFGLMAIGIWLATSMPDVMTREAWIRVGLGFAAAIMIVSGVYMPILSRLTPLKPELKPVHQRLTKIAEIASKNSGITPRHVWLADSPIANAIAFPLINSVAFTTRTMEILDDDECLSVMYHEYGHLREPWIVRLMRLLPTLSFFVFTFARPMNHALDHVGILLLLILFILIHSITHAVMRRMEHRADDHANALTDHSAVYARALEKLHEASQIPAVFAAKRMTHPDLYDRMMQAGLTPAYDPPLPPDRISWAATLLIFLSILSMILLFANK
jgi:Zn-dependent protease with chaperone function